MSSTQVVPVQLDDGTIVYVEAEQNTASPELSNGYPTNGYPEMEVEQKKGGHKGLLKTLSAPPSPSQSMQMVQNTIRSYTTYSLNAFKNLGSANVDEVTLEFGINFSADAGVPYIANGKAQSSLKITVKCSYANQSIPENGSLPIIGNPGAAS